MKRFFFLTVIAMMLPMSFLQAEDNKTTTKKTISQTSSDDNLLSLNNNGKPQKGIFDTIEDAINNHERQKFTGHWVGAGGGFSNYTSKMSIDLPPVIDYMELNTSQSYNVQVNFTQKSIGITRWFGLVTGLGLSWDNFRFDGKNNIQKVDGERNSIYVFDNPEYDAEVSKSTLNVVYATLPLLAEVQIPRNRPGDGINFAAGAIASMKVQSWSKIVLESGDKFNNDSDFNFNMFMLSGTVRLSYEFFIVYANYGLTPLFRATKTPADIDLHPFEIGLMISFNH